MTDRTIPDDGAREAAAARLRALSLDNYRRTRWAAIDAARNAQMTWAEIGEALGTELSATRRMWLKKPDAE